MILVSSIIIGLYVLLILALIIGFNKIETFKAENTNAKTTFSVIIPFRDEAKNLPELLASIEALKYPETHFEIIFVDDASEDDSVKIINSYLQKTPFDCAQGDDKASKDFGISRTNIKIITNNRQSHSPKKDAITSAISISKYDWIVTTDADCILPKQWLNSFNAFILEKNCDMVVAPVTYYKVNSFLKQFQLLDFLSLIGATIGGFGIGKPFLCNGANLAYKKSLFLNLNGFIGNDDIASGDDIFLLEKAIKQDKKSVRFLKSEDAIVKTKPQPTLSSLIAQRKRWAAKTSSYNSTFGKAVGLIVLLANATLIVTLTLSILGLFPIKILPILFVFKSAVDFMLLIKTGLFFNQLKHLSFFLFCSIIYPFFSVYIACVSMFSKYKWKGRTFSK